MLLFPRILITQRPRCLHGVGIVSMRGLKCHWDLPWFWSASNTRVAELWLVYALCCQMDYPLRRSLSPPPVYYALPADGQPCVCCHGNNFSVRWIPSPRVVCNHGAFIGSQPDDLTAARWEEGFTALRMHPWAQEPHKNRQQGHTREIKKNLG